MPRNRLFGALVLLISLARAAGVSAHDLSGTYGLLVENDVFTGADRHYTNGVRFAYLSSADDVPDYIRSFAGAMPLIRPGATLRAGYAVGHSLFTPQDIHATDLIPDDRPYAGYFYAGVAVVAEADNILDAWEVDIGLVGPSAHGETVQNEFHRLIGSPEARGWNHQLRDEPTLALTHERKWRHLWNHPRSGLGLDVTPHLGGSIGNVATYLHGGVTVRIGEGLARDFGPPRIQPSLPGSAFFLPADQVGWYVYAGVDGRAVANNLFLDGNTFRESHHVDKKTWVGDLQAGLVITFPKMQLAYTHVFRTREFTLQREGDHFGAISLSFRL